MSVRTKKDYRKSVAAKEMDCGQIGVIVDNITNDINGKVVQAFRNHLVVLGESNATCWDNRSNLPHNLRVVVLEKGAELEIG